MEQLDDKEVGGGELGADGGGAGIGCAAAAVGRDAAGAGNIEDTVL